MKNISNMILLNMEEKSCVRIINGNIPVLLSAPHVFSHRRPSLTMSYKWGEKLTDEIVEGICTRTGAWGVIQSEETSFDPNWHKLKENPYKSVVNDIVQKEKIKRFIDIHGLKDEYEYDFGIYYPSKFFKSISLSKEIAKVLNQGKLRGSNICIFRLLDDYQETLGEYCANKLRVPSVQIEIARYIREDDKLRNEVINSLSSFLVV
ncbi:hypothetical protein GX618_02850 [Candidatus Dojkabacteria bacterium]|uniref:Uncharacterized protein n=1 Tax=Candidatus Dojkabacteria bacterium TaxID=2099670 RepID=A0A847ETP3_9BACT|nr:hypothetical protein [Candidatus Dojkabacteria bacterium]